jgi:hypothetical protein
MRGITYGLRITKARFRTPRKIKRSSRTVDQRGLVMSANLKSGMGPATVAPTPDDRRHGLLIGCTISPMDVAILSEQDWQRPSPAGRGVPSHSFFG